MITTPDKSLIGTRYSQSSNVTISGHEYIGGSMVTDDIGYELHQNFRTHEFVVIVTKTLRGILQVTDVAKLRGGPEDAVMQTCFLGTARDIGGDLDMSLVGVVRVTDRTVGKDQYGEPYRNPRQVIEITDDGLAVEPRMSGTGIDPTDIQILCGEEGWGA